MPQSHSVGFSGQVANCNVSINSFQPHRSILYAPKVSASPQPAIKPIRFNNHCTSTNNETYLLKLWSWAVGHAPSLHVEVAENTSAR